MPFRDRVDAGQQLAQALERYADQPDVLVLGLPRGGVPVAYEVARALHVPLDVFLVRKLGVPGHEELAMGAIASGGVRVLNMDVLQMERIRPEVVDQVTASEDRELRRRQHEYRGDRPFPELRGKTVILVDDGLATGATMRAALFSARQQQPRALVVAVPVAPPETCAALRADANDVVCLLQPSPFVSAGSWYEDFSATSDEEVRDKLAGGDATASGGAAGD